VDGDFARGDTIAILSLEGREIARGLSSYDAQEARLISGKKSADIEAVLGYSGRAAMVHRDDMVMSVERKAKAKSKESADA
jgi:glutamate 5-kinase